MKYRCGFASVLVFSMSCVHANEWSGNVALETRLFAQDGAPQQERAYYSLAAQPEYFHKWDDGKQSFTFVPFARVDRDAARTHLDVRELTWLYATSTYEMRLGVRKVFWGVTEAEHLVDIINQTDALESPDGKDKLGQPMLNLALIQSWGTLDLFVLPGFREREFPGVEGRPRALLPVDSSQTSFDSSSKQRHVDAAARWHKTLGDWDIGLSYFSGTSRDPRLASGIDNKNAQVLLPHYDLINQTGLDMQATVGAWLWKLESIRRNGQAASYNGATGGVEYTFSNVAESGIDAGMIGEYLYDSRGNAALTPFQNDVMLGCRLAFNDEQSTELLLGAIFDTSGYNSRVYSVEGSRRIGAQWKIGFKARAYVAVAENDSLYSQRNDDYLQLDLARYF
jgi:hypothetical protein